MAITINGGTNAITGLAVGGLPDGTVDADTLANNFDDKIQSNIALLAFKTATNGSLAKFCDDKNYTWSHNYMPS